MPDPVTTDPAPWRPIAIPTHGHPLVRRLFREANRQRVPVVELARRSGVSEGTIHKWRTSHYPGLDAITAAWGALGYELALKRVA